MKKFLDVCYNEETKQCLDIYLPDAQQFKTFVYFHGGGIQSGDKSDVKFFCEYLAEHGIAAVSVNYRMYPDAKYPEFILDVAESVAWVFKNIENYGKSTGIYVGGSSAGGYMSQLLCFNKEYLAAHNINIMDIAGFVHDAGQPTAHFNVLTKSGIDGKRVIIDERAPLYYVGVDKEYPPMLIIVSDNDMFNRFEQTQLLITTLKHFGHSDKITYKLMHGNHCAYVEAETQDDDGGFGKTVADFILAN